MVQGKVQQPYGAWDPMVVLKPADSVDDPGASSVIVTSLASDPPGVAPTSQPQPQPQPIPVFAPTATGYESTALPLQTGGSPPSDPGNPYDPGLGNAKYSSTPPGSPQPQPPVDSATTLSAGAPNEGSTGQKPAVTASVGGISMVFQPDGSIKIGSQTIYAGSSPIIVNGHTVALSPHTDANHPTVVIDGWIFTLNGTADPAPPADPSQPHDPAISSSPSITSPALASAIAGVQFTELPGGTIVIGGTQTLSPGASTTLNPGMAISVAAGPNNSGTALIVNGTTIALPSISVSAPTSTEYSSPPSTTNGSIAKVTSLQSSAPRPKFGRWLWSLALILFVSMG
jgi:hypothetical protein